MLGNQSSSANDCDRENERTEQYESDNEFYEQEMAKKHKEALCEDEATFSHLDFEEELLKYESTYVKKRINSKTNVLDIWGQNQENILEMFPNVYKVARVCLAAPGTQVTVEQLFSQLAFILNDLRDNLTSDNVDNVLIVRCNFDHLDDAFFYSILQRT